MSTEASAANAPEQHGTKRVLVGKVTSAKMQKTIVVEVVRSVKHPVYGKYVRRRKKYKAHDETQQYKVGDVVEIRESKPMSRDKRWTAITLVRRPEET
jgi:small subunit ribosomal protein S17